MASKLRAVGRDEVPAPVKKHTVTSAAEHGSRRDLLVAMRDRIAKAVEDPNCPPRDLAALSRRLTEIAKDIEALDVSAEEDARERRGPAEDEAWDAAAL